MTKLTIKQFSDINLYNHKNIESVMERMISESANGVLVSVFDDKIVLFDNYEQEFYSADYEFNSEELVMDNFEKIKLTRDRKSFNDAVKGFFKDEVAIEDVNEAYENIFSEQEVLLSEDINSKILRKKSNYDFFNAILEAKKKVDLTEFHKTKLYESYFKRYIEKPSESIYFFDWKSPVCVSMVTNEEKSIYIKTNKEKAKNIWKEEEFRKSFNEAVEILLDDVAGGQKKLIKLITENKDLLALNDTEFKEIVSKTVLMEDYAGNSKNIIEGVMTLYKKFELGRVKEELRNRFNITEEDTKAAPAAADGAPTDGSKENPPEQPTNEELDKTIEALGKLVGEIKDEKAKKFIDGLIQKVNAMKKEGSVDPELLKEIARLLAPAPEEEKPAEENTPAEKSTTIPAAEAKMEA